MRMFGDRFSSSTGCSRWLHETEPARLDQSRSCRFLKVATQPSEVVLGCEILNRMTEIGRPVSYRVGR